MLNQDQVFDQLFHALADPSRRSMVERLGFGEASVKELAEPLAMSLPSVMQHLGVLEGAGLVRSEKRGRVRICVLQPDALGLAEGWLTARRRSWERRLDRLEKFLDEDQQGDGS